MALRSGTSLGPYQIDTPLGAGGMGEVYKATDTRLHRTVAIKVLPEHVASDPDLKQRFEREARTVAALNHPHICTLHDIGSQDGIDFLVMEYLAGQTLAERLEKGALPLDQALQIAIDIADALDKAHRQGIVHRDLKPGNIMLTKAGAKLLDFGLAKLKPPEQAGGLSALPTQAAGDLTQRGAILGTFQYMAPEQLEGGEADQRTDVFAFGTVVYEMVTGRKAFEGKSQASLIGAILKDEPQPMSELQEMSPPALDLIVKTCLAKDPDERWQSLGDVGRQIALSASRIHEGREHPQRPSARNTAWRHSVVSPVIVSSIAALITGLVVWMGTQSEAPPPRPVARLSVALPADQRLTVSARDQVALSPTGTHLVYTANFRLYLRAMDELEATAIIGTETATNPFFSPNGQWVGFYQAGELKKVAVTGGAAITLCDTAAPRGVTWGPANTILFSDGANIQRVSGDGGTPEVLISAPADTGVRRPQMLPGGKAVLFTMADLDWSDDGIADWRGTARIVVEVLETGERLALVQGGADGRYLPTGHLVYLSGETLFVVPFDAERLEVMGAAVPLVHGVARQYGSGVAQFATSNAGLLVYAPGGGRGELRSLVWVDRAGREEVLTDEARPFQYPRLSPDEQQIALAIAGGSEQSSNRDIWLYERARDQLRRLTFHSGEDESPLWTPDGEYITFAGTRGTERLTLRRAADGSGEDETIGRVPGHHHLGGWSPDGQTVVFAASDNAWLATGDDEPRVPAFLTASAAIEAPSFSPDGAWLLYASVETGRNEIYVQSFPGGGDKRQVSTEGGTEPLWSRDGTEIFYRNDDWMMSVSVDTREGFAQSPPVPLFQGRYDELPAGERNYDVTADGTRFLMVKPLEERDHLVMVFNWFQELRALVPTN